VGQASKSAAKLELIRTSLGLVGLLLFPLVYSFVEDTLSIVAGYLRLAKRAAIMVGPTPSKKCTTQRKSRTDPSLRQLEIEVKLERLVSHQEIAPRQRLHHFAEP